MIQALSPGLDALTLLLATLPEQQRLTANFLFPSDSALARVLDASPHGEQATSLTHLERLNDLLGMHTNVNIILQWLPAKIPFIGFQRARQLAFEAIHTANLAHTIEPHTIKSQKEKSKSAAISEWATRWHEAPRTSFTYRTTLLEPPDRKLHSTFQPLATPHSPQPQDTDPPGRITNPNECDRAQEKVKFSRLTHSTLYHFITGHAFTGEYTQRFYPLHTSEQVACPCGEPIQTVEHVLLSCPLHTTARRKHLTANGRPRSLTQLFTQPKHVQALLRFLEETGACAKPRVRWEPG